MVLAVGEDYRLAIDVPVLFDFLVCFPSEFFVDSALRSSVVVELYVVGFEETFNLLMISVGEFSRSNALLKGFNLYRRPVFIAPTDHYSFFASKAQVSSVDVSRQELGERSEVGSGVHVRPSCTYDPFPQSPIIPSNRNLNSDGGF